jgi:hypothetical protein
MMKQVTIPVLKGLAVWFLLSLLAAAPLAAKGSAAGASDQNTATAPSG